MSTQKVLLPKVPEFSVSMKYKAKPSELYMVKDAEDVANVARMCFDADTMEWVESFIVIGLNHGGKVIGFYKISQGGMTGTIADPRTIFQFALLSGAVKIIIAHNHPSGTLYPSQADIQITNKINDAGKLLDITLLDHVIVTSESYYSFAENGQI